MTPVDARDRLHVRSAPAAGRLEGVDLARALAIVGMLMVHVGPMYGDSWAERLYALPHGRASVLFMLVAGVSVSLLARARREAPGVLTGQLLWRAALLLPAGLTLQVIDTGRLVILQTYALMFVLAVVAVRLSDRAVCALVGVAAVVGPMGFLYGRITEPLVYNRGAVALGQSPGEILHGLVLSGPYPLITWIVPFLTGLWLGRRDLRNPALRSLLVLGGAGLAIVSAVTAILLQEAFGRPGFGSGWLQLIRIDPHSEMPLWLYSATGSAVALLGLSLAAAERAGRALWPLVATGQLALTFYVAHLLALTGWPLALQSGEVGEAVRICLVFTTVAALIAVIWRAFLRHGPLEMLLQPPWAAVRRWSVARR